MRPLAQVFSRRSFAVFALATCAAPSTFAGEALFVTNDANDQVRRYAGDTGAFQTISFASVAPAAQQLAIHFGGTQNRVLVGHNTGGVQEFNATTGAYIKTYNPSGGVQWAGIYAPNGNVLIGSWNTKDVREYNSFDATYVRTLTSVGTPSDMVIGPNGNLFICSFNGGAVKEVNVTSGAFVSQWSTPIFAHLTDIAFNPANGEILVAATGVPLVYRYANNTAHTLLSWFQGTGWHDPHGIIISPWTGNVLVVDGVTSQVHEFHPTTYVELNPAFLVPAPGEKICDLAFFQPPPVVATPFCPGVGPVTPCPCGNAGAAGHGCASSAYPGGALLSGFGNAGTNNLTDTLVLTASDVSGPVLFMQANGIVPAVNFGDGHLCAGVGIIRLGVVFPTGGSASFPNGAVPIHTAGFVNNTDTKHYQCWYRSNPGLCGPDNHNLTQGLSITFGP